MLERIYTGKVFYEIIGVKDPELIKYTVGSYELKADGSVEFPDKYIGLASYSEGDFGVTVFEDESSARVKLEQIRRRLR